MWRVWYLKHRVREILENKDGVGVVEIFSIKPYNFSFVLKNAKKPFIYKQKWIL